VARATCGAAACRANTAARSSPDYFGLVGQRADILVTRGPSSHPHGFDAIDELGRSLGVSKAFHGHHHDRLDYSSHRERLGFDAFGVGFCGQRRQWPHGAARVPTRRGRSV
jgi:hypothetical protein